MRKASNLVVDGSSLLAPIKNNNVGNKNLTCDISCIFQISFSGAGKC